MKKNFRIRFVDTDFRDVQRFQFSAQVGSVGQSDQIRSDEVFNLFFWFPSDEVKNYFISSIFLVLMYVFFEYVT